MFVVRSASRIAKDKKARHCGKPTFKQCCNSAPSPTVAGGRFDLEACEPRWLLAATSTITPNLQIVPDRSPIAIEGYTPAQIKKAYDFTGLRATGAGQTIAIVDAYNDPNIAEDLAVFDKEFGLAAPPTFSVVSQTGGSTRSIASDAGWAGEIALDVEWAHAMAPGAGIVLVEASSDSEQDLMAAADYARTIRGVSVVSMSWGESEDYSQTSYDAYFTTPSGHTGVTFVAASGDDGAAGGAEYPASSPNVLAVGGTTLDLTSGGAISSETAWSDSSGGQSLVETAPSYQSAVSGNTARTTPDVAYDADPNTGFAVYDSISYEGIVGWQEVGGTSAGTPQWAGIIALADQVRAANRLAPLNGQTQTLPALYSLYAAPGSSGYSTYTSYFNDITSGSSSGTGGGRFGGFDASVDSTTDTASSEERRRGRHGGFGSVSAAAGYDTLTGLGSPKISDIVAALVSWGNASVSAIRTGRAASINATASVARQDVISVATPNNASHPLSNAALAADLRWSSAGIAGERSMDAAAEDSSIANSLSAACVGSAVDAAPLDSSNRTASIAARSYETADILTAAIVNPPAPRAVFSGAPIASAPSPAGVELRFSGASETAGVGITIASGPTAAAPWAWSDDVQALSSLSAGLAIPSSPLEVSEKRFTAIRWISAVTASVAVTCVGFLSGHWHKRTRIAESQEKSEIFQAIERR